MSEDLPRPMAAWVVFKLGICLGLRTCRAAYSEQ